MRRRVTRFAPALIVAVCAGGMASASAQEYCVVCVAPGAKYRCKIENNGPGQKVPLPQACIMALSKHGQHQSCSISGGTVLECDGAIKRVDILGKPDKLPPGTPVPTEPYVLAEPKKPEPDPETPPRTVQEAVQRAGKSMGEGASKTSQAINDSARKTWNCLTSFFKSC